MPGGLKTCDELEGVNLNAYELKHARKTRHLRSLNVMSRIRFHGDSCK